jgi:predicted amidophosphoribosyltransferase
MCECGHVWNTFDTHGVCPGCGHAWTATQCPHCQQWSRHDDWYERDGRGRAG